MAKQKHTVEQNMVKHIEKLKFGIRTFNHILHEKVHGFTQKETHLLSKCFLLNAEPRLSLVVWVQSTIQTPCQHTCETAHVSNAMVNVHCLEAAWNCPLLTHDRTPPGKLIESAQPA